MITRNFDRISRAPLILFLVVFLVVCDLDGCFGKRGGGGGGRAGGGRVGSSRAGSGSRSSYGSSSASGSSARVGSGSSSGSSSSRYGGSSGTSGTGSRWGSSAPSGGGSGFSSGNRYGARPGYAGGGAQRAPSATYARVSSPTSAGVARSRPQTNIPRATQSHPTQVVYSSTYVNYGAQRSGFGGGSMLLAGGAGLIGGYYLGRMMGSAYRPYGYGGYGGPGYGPNYYDSYQPYQARYGGYYMTTTPSPTIQGQPQEAPKKTADLCTLARWNRELPFTELPNMAVDFLANDTISGTTTAEKSQFVFTFFKATVDAYANYNNSDDIFTIPSGYDLKQCNFQSAQGFDVTKPAPGGPEEPILTALRNIIGLYSNVSKEMDDLKDVVAAAKECLPRGGVVNHPEVLPCLDFSMNPDQLLNLKEPQSVFASGEICRRQLNPDMFKCIQTSKTPASTCTVENLLALNLFARNYYLCSDLLEKETADRLRQEFDSRYQAYDNALTNRPFSLVGLLLLLLSAKMMLGIV